MFSYLFFIAAAMSPSELPTTINEDKELQELITILTTQDTPETAIEDITETTAQDTLPTQETSTKPAEETTKEPVVEKIASPIIITNAIESHMLAYKHWTGTYNPEIFTVQINGTEVAQGAQHTLPAETKTVDLSFYYSFVSGMRTGTKTVSYQLNENITQATITFSWKDDHKILLDNSTFLKVI